MNMLSPHSPMPPPPMSPMSEQFSSPPPPPSPQQQQVRQAAPPPQQQQQVVRFHQNGNTAQNQHQVQLQVQIQQQQQYPQIRQQPTGQPQQQQPVLTVDHQMLKNIERKERMRQIEQQRSGTAPWQASGQIIMNQQFVNNGQNGQAVARFINQSTGQPYYPPNVRFVQNTPQQIRMMRPQVNHYPQPQFQQIQQQPQPQQMLHMVQPGQPINYIQQQQQQQQQNDTTTNNPDSFLNPPARSPSSLVDQYIIDPIPKSSETPQEEKSQQITINGKIQIEPVGSATFPTGGVGINIAPKMNSNFSNNGEDEKETDETEKKEQTEVKTLKEQPVVAKAIPQLDGFFDDSDDELIPQFDGADDEKPPTSQQPIVLSSSSSSSSPKDRTKSPQKHTQLKLVLGDPTKAKKGARGDAFRFTSQSGTIPPRNISPKPKENSPKSGTIVATAKVTKPSSPSSHGSPQVLWLDTYIEVKISFSCFLIIS